MPSYTIDNPSNSLDKAAECVKRLLGENATVSSISQVSFHRITVTTVQPIDPSKISLELAKLVPKQEAAKAPAAAPTVNPPVSMPSEHVKPPGT